MLATKKLSRIFSRCAPTTAAIFLLWGCTPPGPRALLDGDRLLEKGKNVEAVEQLKIATTLMPGNPRAWNHLGLALHAAGQPPPAVLAYKQALALNRSNVVNSAHYNLGCLYLEQNNLPAAIDELRSFTMLTNSAPALVKLGTAQLRARHPDAEKSFTAALKLQPRDPEALNGMGLLQAQRGRVREAVQFFNAALLANPKYGPALLNYGIVAQQQTATRPAALQKYRDYLALQPRPQNWDAVSAVARQLELELTPPRVAATNLAVVPALLKTNPVAVAVSTGAPPRVVTVSPTQQVAVARTPVTTVVLTNPIAVRPPTNDKVVTVLTPPRTNPIVAGYNAEVKTNRPGLLTRLNPFRDKPKVETNAPRTLLPITSSNTAGNFPTSVPRALPVPRYKYLSPSKPSAGNRAEAERAYQLGAQAQQAGRTADSLVAFRAATQADPSWFDGQYGLGLAAYQAGDWKQALAADELALALNGDSLNTRYNFALALKQAGYARDSADELEKVLLASPDDARAHLTLGNLYAQTLAQPKVARAHYLRVLELEPRNAQAGMIRYWLSANP